MTILYAVLHFLVDGICAFTMFGRFLSLGNAALDLILYNFCAFALQMPFGVILDYLEMKSAAKADSKIYSYYAASAGVLCTILGTVTHPVILGIGNALFHIGGGVGTIHEDNTRNWKGRGLGVFVAPGALGLYLGTLAAQNGANSVILWLISIIMVLICAPVKITPPHYLSKIHTSTINNTHNPNIQTLQCSNETSISAAACDQVNTNWHIKIYVFICCLLVVMLRSYIGMTVTFSWKTTTLSGILAVLAVVLGKIAGGFLAAKYGFKQTIVISLAVAAIAYMGSSVMPIGLVALFLFNMTMPITLYLIICQFPQMMGFSFGVLTFGLFLGFLPVYFGLPLMISGNIIGSVGSVLSLLLLMGTKMLR